MASPSILQSSSSSSSSSTDQSSSEEDQETVSHRYRKRVQRMMNLFVAPQMLKLLSQPGGRRFIRRDREGNHRQLWRDYFAENCTYPADHFHRRFRMRKELFLRILKDVETYDNYFVQKKDSTGRLGCSSIQKVTTAIRILAYGCSRDQREEYLDIGKSTAIESLTTSVMLSLGYMRGNTYANQMNMILHVCLLKGRREASQVCLDI